MVEAREVPPSAHLSKTHAAAFVSDAMGLPPVASKYENNGLLIMANTETKTMDRSIHETAEPIPREKHKQYTALIPTADTNIQHMAQRKHIVTWTVRTLTSTTTRATQTQDYNDNAHCSMMRKIVLLMMHACIGACM